MERDRTEADQLQPDYGARTTAAQQRAMLLLRGCYVERAKRDGFDGVGTVRNVVGAAPLGPSHAAACRHSSSGALCGRFWAVKYRAKCVAEITLCRAKTESPFA